MSEYRKQATDRLIRHIANYTHSLGNGALGVLHTSPEYKDAMERFDAAAVAGDEARVKDTGNDVYRLVKRLVEKREVAG